MLDEFSINLLRYYSNYISSTLSRQDIDAGHSKFKEVLTAVLSGLDNKQIWGEILILCDKLSEPLREKIKFIIDLLRDEDKPWQAEFRNIVREIFANKLCELKAHDSGSQLPAEIVQTIVVNLSDDDVKRAASLSHFWLDNAIDCYRNKLRTNYNIDRPVLNVFTLAELQRINAGLAHLTKMSLLKIPEKNAALSLFSDLQKPSVWLIYLLADNVSKFISVRHNISDEMLMCYATVANSINILKSITSLIPNMNVFAMSASYSNARIFNYIKSLNPSLEMG